MTVLDRADPRRSRCPPPCATARRPSTRPPRSSSFMAELLAGRVDERRLRALPAAPARRLRRPRVDRPRAGRRPVRRRRARPRARAPRRPRRRPRPLGARRRRARAPPPPPTAYVERAPRLPREWGGLFVAHHYTRYLGDLSGGQAIGRILDREFALGGRRLAFYAFAAVPKPKPYKDAYRARLDALGLERRGQGPGRRRGQVAFRLNRRCSPSSARSCRRSAACLPERAPVGD